MMNPPRISLIIPVRNGDRTLRDCLDSCLNQNFNDYELIIVDNLSSDGTGDIIREYEKKDKRIKHVVEEKIGRGSARNSGIAKAKGDIITWTDADCVVPEDWLERLTYPIRKTCVDVVQGNEESISDGFLSREAQKAGQRHIRAHILEDDMIDHIDTKNLAIKTVLLKNVGSFDPNLKALEDFDLKIRLKKRGIKIYYVEDLSVKHHHREDLLHLFQTRFEQGYWAAKVYFKHMNFFNESKHKDNTIRSMYPLDFLMFPIHLILSIRKYGISSFIFETITGIMWRMGNIKGRFDYCRKKKGG